MPDPQLNYRLALTKELRSISLAIDAASEATRDLDAESREAVVLAVSEFAENVVKYSASDDGVEAGFLTIVVADDHVVVTMSNPVHSEQDARVVFETIEQIENADVDDLYLARMTELHNSPKLARTALGLLRVAFEGRFRFTAAVEDGQLKVVAKRKRETKH